jgi:hypothetical protein
MLELVMKFEDLKFDREDGEEQAFADCGNYQVSVVRNALSYGGDKGLYEIGVFRKDTNRMCDPLSWGDDVKGWLSPSDVEEQLELISKAE